MMVRLHPMIQYVVRHSDDFALSVAEFRCIKEWRHVIVERVLVEAVNCTPASALILSPFCLSKSLFACRSRRKDVGPTKTAARNEKLAAESMQVFHFLQPFW